MSVAPVCPHDLGVHWSKTVEPARFETISYAHGGSPGDDHGNGLGICSGLHSSHFCDHRGALHRDSCQGLCLATASSLVFHARWHGAPLRLPQTSFGDCAGVCGCEDAAH